MTLLDRLRAWLGSALGGESSDASGVDAAPDGPGPRSEGSNRQVVHRDDRPLETPGTPDGDRETTIPSRTESPDAEGETAPASIPDAEVAAGEAATTGTDRPGEPGDDASGADTIFACSVCGTTVDDPSDPCPLCRSTDVGPVADTSEEESPTHGGRTAISTADDEAVDRLRDVTEDG